jgi:hypothetical protein
VLPLHLREYKRLLLARINEMMIQREQQIAVELRKLRYASCVMGLVL